MRELFGNHIEPACCHCELAYPSDDPDMLICMKKGLVRQDFSCRAFQYDPLMRIPRRPRQLETFREEDFQL